MNECIIILQKLNFIIKVLDTLNSILIYMLSAALFIHCDLYTSNFNDPTIKRNCHFYPFILFFILRISCIIIQYYTPYISSIYNHNFIL